MRPRLGLVLSLLAACGIHAVILFVPRAAFVEDVHVPTVELELTEVAGPPALAKRPAVVVPQPVGARASSRVDVPRQPEVQSPAPAEQPGAEPAPAAPGGQEDAPAVDQPAAGLQPGSAQSGIDKGDTSSGPESAGSQAGNTTTSFSTTAAVPAFVPPRPLAEILPKYPISARRSGFEGVVKVSVLVDENGAVTSVEVFSSSGHASLDQAVLDAYRRARFAPALQDGKPVAGRVVIPVRFRLAGGLN